MTKLGYHASHEQFPPHHLLDLVTDAEAAGFECILASDHFHPWSERQGESAHVWSWLGGAMLQTSVPFSTVSAPGYRYHPAVLAQAIGTLRSMYGDRFTPCLGSGQLLNEGITGTRWPTKSSRNERLEECATVMRRLLAGETVSHEGHISTENATLFTRSNTSPSLFGAALSTGTARWLADWADGLITLATPDHEGDRERIRAFKDRAPDKPVFLKAQISYGDEDTTAIEGAYSQWRTNCIPRTATQEMRTPDDYDALGELVDREDLKEHIRISDDIDQHREWVETDLSLDVERIFLHNVHPNQADFIETFGEEVLPTASS